MKFYNEAIKNRYLDSLDNEGTRHVVSYIFEASKTTEEILEKDLYNFSINEVGLVLKNMQLSTINTAKTNMFNIKSYIAWAIRNGYRTDNINPLIGVSDDWASQYIDKIKKIHWSKDELYEEIITNLENPQDQALLVLIFNGVKGEQFKELRELRFEDINWDTGEVFIASREHNQTIKLFDNNDLKIIENAFNQKVYNVPTEENPYKSTRMIDSGYILKNLLSKRVTEPKEISMAVLYSRLGNIKEQFDLDYLTPNSIVQSGQIYMAVKLWEKYGKLEKEEFSLIGDKFNLSKMKSDDYEYYNRSAMKNYINKDSVKKLYGIEVIID